MITSPSNGSETSQGAMQPSRPDQVSGLYKAWAIVLPFALIFAGACLLLFGNLGKYPLFNPDEALYAEPAREMLELGEYVTTYLNYVVRFTKPPLVIWAQALSIMAFGVNEFAVRFFEAASGAVLIACTYWFVERFLGKSAAIIASLSLCTAPLFIGTAREAITDMPLSLFMAGAMMAFFVYQKSLKEKISQKKFLYLAYILLGLSVMTKGPVGLVLPLTILSTFHCLKGNLLASLKSYQPLVGLAIVGLIALPWFATEIYLTKGAYFNEFIMRENFARFTTAIDSHGAPPWYHLAAMAGGFFPWSLFIPQAIVAALSPAIAASYRGLGLKAAGKELSTRLFGNQDSTKELAIYSICWVLVTLAFFSVSVSKLIPYTLPAFPALSVILAIEFLRIRQENGLKRALIPTLLIALVFAAATALSPTLLTKLRDAPQELLKLGRSLAAFETLAALITIVLICRRKYQAAFLAFALSTFAAYLFFGNKILGELSKEWEEPLPEMARFAAVSGHPILVFDMRKPSIPFYALRPVIQPGNDQAIIDELAKHKSAYIITTAKKRPWFQSLGECKVVLTKGKFILLHWLGN